VLCVHTHIHTHTAHMHTCTRTQKAHAHTHTAHMHTNTNTKAAYITKLVQQNPSLAAACAVAAPPAPTEGFRLTSQWDQEEGNSAAPDILEMKPPGENYVLTGAGCRIADKVKKLNLRGYYKKLTITNGKCSLTDEKVEHKGFSIDVHEDPIKDMESVINLNDLTGPP